MTSRNTNAALAGINAFSTGYRNKLINGDFVIWQRNVTQTSNGYGSDDRWRNAHTGSTKTHSLQAFALGQTEIPGNPIWFSRTVVSSVAGAGNIVYKSQAIENVIMLQGKTVTLTFYARADATRNIAVDFVQSFGSGGSAVVDSIGARLIPLTTLWKKFTYTVQIPSIAGKTLGNGDHFTAVRFWFDAGSSFAAQSAGLGQQSGTFDIARVSLVEGDATLEDDPFTPRHSQQELALCQRYFVLQMAFCTATATGGGQLFGFPVFWPVTMRTTPTTALAGSITASNVTSENIYVASIYGCKYQIASSGAGTAYVDTRMIYADAEL
jgi:hypothetical protein